MTTTISRRDGTFSCIGVARLDSGLARLDSEVASMDSEVASMESASERAVGERSSGRIRRPIRLRACTRAYERSIPTCGQFKR